MYPSRTCGRSSQGLRSAPAIESDPDQVAVCRSPTIGERTSPSTDSRSLAFAAFALPLRWCQPTFESQMLLRSSFERFFGRLPISTLGSLRSARDLLLKLLDIHEMHPSRAVPYCV